MLQRSPLLPMACIAILLCVGCVAKSDYLQKQAEADTLGRDIAALAAESAGLKDQVSRANADRKKLIAERDELNARLANKTTELARAGEETARTIAEMARAIDEVKIKNLELEGDKQMLQESIDLLRKAKEDLTNRNSDLENRRRALQENVAVIEGEMRALQKNAAVLESEKRALQGNVASLEGEKHVLQDNIAELKKTREEAVQTVSKTYEDLLGEMKEEIEQGQVAITELKGKLTMDVVDKILFDSGQAEVKQEGLVVLKRVISILKTVTDKTIRVEGHTDNVPIGGILAKRYPTNWELSAARAINVARYLEHEGIDPALLSAAAFGEFQPIADNDTPEGRAKNRRIAIILLPKE